MTHRRSTSTLRNYRRVVAVAMGASLTLVATACSSGSSPQPIGRDSADPRTNIHIAALDTLWHIGGGPDSHLRAPFRVRLSDSLVFVLDTETQAVHALRRDGTPLWAYGADPDATPDERNIRDIKIDRQGNVLILDPRRSLIEVVSPAGQLLTALRDSVLASAEQIVLLSGDRLGLHRLAQDTAMTVIALNGTYAGVIPLPISDWAGRDVLERQALIASHPADGSWVTASSVSDEWSHTSPHSRTNDARHLIDRRDLPPINRVVRNDTAFAGFARYVGCSACDIAVADSSLYVLAGGTVGSNKEVIDRYSLTTGHYVSSLRLGGRYKQFSISGDTLFLIADATRDGILAVRVRND